MPLLKLTYYTCFFYSKLSVRSWPYYLFGRIPNMAESTDIDELLQSFKKFAIHGDTKATGKEMNGKNWAKLCKDCKVIDGKTVTGTDVDIVFTKVK